MNYILRNGSAYVNGAFTDADLLVKDGVIAAMGQGLSCEGAEVIDCQGKIVVPGLVDLHVHLREPGFEYKETVATGTAAAAAGGYTTILSMPNLNPVPDNVEALKVQLAAIEKDACIHVLPFASITVGQKGQALSDIDGLAGLCVGFSDDGKGVQSETMMLEAMELVKKNGSFISAHCEDESLLEGGSVHKGEFAALMNLRGISSASEYVPIVRDIALAEKTGVQYHICHISAKESIDAVRQGKCHGVNVTCEVTPHHIALCDMDIKSDDGKYKMNPPLRGREDMQALIEGIVDGTIDMIATDHAPHSAEEKGRGLEKSAMGVVGLETSFPACYTYLVKPGIITMEKLMELMSTNPRQRFDLPMGNDFSVWDLDAEYTVDPADFLSMGKATPFTGTKVFGKCVMTVCDGKIVYLDKEALK